MAKYIGLLTADARGKVGGAVLSRSTAGTTLKSHTVPKRPSSIAQQRAQHGMANALIAWRNLTSTNQTSWNVYAQGVTYTDSLGTTYHPSGLQLWTQAWINGQHSGLTPPSTIPGFTVIPPPILTLEIQRVGSALLASATNFSGFYPTFMLWFASAVIAPSRNYVRNANFRFLITATSGASIDVTGQYASAFGTLPSSGQSIALKAFGINATAYVSGASTIVRVTVG